MYQHSRGSHLASFLSPFGCLRLLLLLSKGSGRVLSQDLFCRPSLSSATPFSLSQRGASSVPAWIPRGSRTPGAWRNPDGTLMSPLVSGQCAVYPWVLFRPSRKSSSRAAGCPVAVCWLWSRETGKFSYSVPAVCADNNITTLSSKPTDKETEVQLCWGLAEGIPAAGGQSLGFKPVPIGPKPGLNSAWSLVYTETRYLRFLSSLDLIFIGTVSSLNQDRVLIAPGCPKFPRPDWLNCSVHWSAYCSLPLVSFVWDSEFWGTPCSCWCCQGWNRIWNLSRWRRISIPAPSVSACQSRYCLTRQFQPLPQVLALRSYSISKTLVQCVPLVTCWKCWWAAK